MGVCKRKDGRWQVTYRDNGKVKARAFPAGRQGKKEALAFDAEIQMRKAKDQPLPLAPREGVYLDELVQLWIHEKKAQGRALRWLREWAAVFNKIFAPALCDRPAHTITQADVVAVVGAHYASHTQATRNRYTGYLKSALEYGVAHGMIQANPLSRWKAGKEPRRASALTWDDLQKIRSAAAPHLAWALEVAWNIPARPGPSDLFAMRFDLHVKPDRGGVEVFHSKVGRRAFISCSPSFMRVLHARQAMHQSGHIIEYKGKPVKRLDTALETAAKAAKLPYSVCMYDVRHLWITTALDRGLEPSAIAYMAGTSVEMIHANYYEPHAAARGRAVEIMPALVDESPQDQPRKVVGIEEARKRV